MIALNEDGWLQSVEHCPSPNFNERPAGAQVSLLVIHNISLPPGEFGGSWIRDFFCNRLDFSVHPYFEEIRDLRVSAHLLVERDGSVVQFVPLGARAWHAGESCFDDCENCNDFSIGIELEGDDEQPYTDSQYERLAELSAVLMRAYPEITPRRITGHSDIAPGRKTDPGPAFDWERYRSLLQEES